MQKKNELASIDAASGADYLFADTIATQDLSAGNVIVNSPLIVSESSRTEIVFVESNIADYQTLISGLQPGAEIHILDANQDGLAQIAAIMSGRTGVDAIHIISHGSEASVSLGSLNLTSENLQEHAAQLATISGSLTSDADILLYGCDVGAGSDGEALVAALAQATGADIAASNNLTGSATKGGDWIFETVTGTIESSSIVTAYATNYYQDILSIPSGLQTFANISITNNVGTTIDGYFNLTRSDGSGGSNPLSADAFGAYINDGTVPAFTYTSYLEVTVATVGSYNLSGAVIGDYHASSLSTGNDFTNVYVVGYANGVQVAQTASHDSIGVYETNYNFNFSSFNNLLIDTFRVYYTVDSSLNVIQTGFNLESFTVANASTTPINITPSFIGSTTTLSVSENASATSVLGLLHVSDADSSQTETWTQSSAPSHGILSFTSATATSGTTDIAPGGSITYTPTAGFAGTDSFTVQVSDGTATATRTISVNVNPATPGTPDLAAASDSGSSNSDNKTNAASLDFSGTSATGDTTSTVRVFLDKNGNGVFDSGIDPTVTAIVNNSSWTVTGLSTSGVSDGAYNVYALTTSATGSLNSTLSSALAVNLDTAAPTASVTSSTVNNSTNVTSAQSSEVGNLYLVSSTVNITDQASLDNAIIAGTAKSAVVGTANTNTAISTTGLTDGTYKVYSVDAAGNISSASTNSVILDSTVPTVNVVSSSTADGSYKVGDVIAVTVKFSEAVTVSGTPQLTLETGTTDRTINYVSGSGTDSLTFNYTVQSGDTSADLDYFGTTALALNGGTIKDAAGNDGVLTLATPGTVGSLGDSNAFVIDGVVPTLSSSSPVDGDISVAVGDNIVLTFSENVLAGSGNIVISDGSDTRTIAITDNAQITISGNTVTINPTTDLNINATYNVQLASGVITDTAGNAYAGISNTTTLNFSTPDTIAPTVSTLAFTSNAGGDNTYKSGDVVSVTVTMSEATIVSGTPTLVLNVGGSNQIAGYVSGSGGTSLVFSYTVQAGDTDANGISIDANSIDLNGGTLKDASGNDATLTHSAVSDQSNQTVDTTAPNPPSSADLTTDTGTSSTDNITNETTPTFTGTAEADATVTLFDTDGTTVLGTTTADGSGNWSITSSTLTDGAHTLTTKATDAAGNESTVSGGLSVVIDSNTAQPSTPNMTDATDTGSSNTDNITSNATPTFTGTAEIGATVSLYDTDGTTVLGTATADGSGNWTITSAILSEGGHILTAKTTDVAGNLSIASGGLSVTIDTSQPNSPSSADLTTDTGTSSTDDLTNDTTPTFTGTAEANATVTLFDTDGITVLGTTTADGSGNWSITSSTLTDGAHTITTKATDAAGNESTVSGDLSVVIDSSTSTPSVPDLTIASDSGTSNSDDITSEAAPTFTGTAEADSTVTLYDTDGTTVLGSATTDVAGNWSITSSVLADGVHSISAKATDVAGNTSALSTGLSVTIDTTFPNPPSSVDLTTDTGTSSTDDLTKDTTPTFVGTAEADATVTLFDTDGTTVLGTTTADGSGNWSITSSTLSDGEHTITTKATDAAGNESTVSAGLSVVIDSSTTTPSVPDLADASDTGTSNSDDLTDEATPTFIGTAEVDSTVTLYDTDGTTVLGLAITDGTGNWSITSSVLADGAHTVSAKATDAAGNTSSVSSGLSVTIDTVPPTVPSSADLKVDSDTGISSTDNITSNATPIFTGTGQAGVIISLFDTDGITVLGTATVDEAGNWSITSAELSDGSHTITAIATDAAGNDSVAATGLDIIIDTTDPSAASGQLEVEENAENGTVVGIVTAEDAGVLSYILTDNAGGRFAIDSVSGQVTVADGSLLDYETASSHSVMVRATDEAGNSRDTELIVALIDVNEPPMVTANTGFTIDESDSHVLTNAELSVSDVDNSADQLVYTLSTVTTNGTLFFDGDSLSVGDTFTQADIDSGLISYTENRGNVTEDAFTFTVSDGSGGVIDQTTFNISVIHDLTLIGNPSKPQTLTGDGGRNDHLFGGTKQDTLQGLGGNDYLSAGNGNDTLIGDTGRDILLAGAGNDVLNGNDGIDLLYGDSGNDLLNGGAGNDYMIGGLGMDTYRYSATDLGTADLLGGSYDVIRDDGGSRIDFSSSVEGLLKVNGTLLSALSGKVALGSIIDSNNSVAYSQGVIMVDINGDHIFNAEDDYSIEVIGRINGAHYDSKLDMLVLDGKNSLAMTVPEGPAAIQQGLDTDDELVGSSSDDIIYGWKGNDSLSGGDGNDHLNGGNGNDTLVGDDGDDLLDGSFGNDILDGGIGADTLWGSSGNDILIGGAGNDMLVGGVGSDVYSYLATELGIDDLVGGGYDVIQDGKGSWVDFSEDLEALINIGGTSLADQIAKIKLGGIIDDENSIAFTVADGIKQIQIDVDGDGSFDRATDFHIELVGSVSNVAYDAAHDVFVLG